ncbi:MAG TPA: PPC domain-containing protein [Verrucomicrobiota bacterium]|nr:PPC domain-containing protein [Verrucomicrobiota bacterium]
MKKLMLLLYCIVVANIYASAPANDNFTNRIVLPSTNYIYTTGSNVGATMESIESNKVSVPCGKSVWWEWKAPYTGSFLFCTEDSDFDTVLALFVPGYNGAILKVKEDDNGVTPDFITSYASLITFNAVSNTTYYIAVYGKGSGSNAVSGNIVLRIMPDNNMFENAIPLSGERVQTIGFNGQADVQTGETTTIGFSDSQTGRTIWWVWTPPRDGEFLVSTIGSTFNTVLGVYTNLTKLPSYTATWRDDDSGSPFDLTSLVSVSAKSNITYYIIVDGYQEGEDLNDSGKVILSIFPDNNRYTNRTMLTNSTDVSANGRANAETYEIYFLLKVVSDAQSPNSKSVWWEWVAPSNGALTVDTIGSDFDTLLAVYQGEKTFFTAGTDINLITWDDNSASVDSPFSDVCVLGVVPGKAYKIQVMGNGSDGYGKVVVNVSFNQGPANDMFTNRTILPSIDKITVTGNNMYASSEDGEPKHAGLNNGKSVWWSWTAPQTGPVQISTAGSDFDTLLAVYTGNSVTSLVTVATNNDDPVFGDITSSVSFDAIKGITYHIAVDGLMFGYYYESVDNGNIVLSIVQVVSPDNDNFANRILVSGDLINIVGSNQNATKEMGEPSHAGDEGGSSVWWSWRPPFTGFVTISTFGSDFDTTLAVYTGTSVTNLIPIVSNNDIDPIGAEFTSAVTFYASSNITYQIAVDGFQSSTGRIQLKIVLTTPSRILSSVINQNNSFVFSANGLVGHYYEIQVSDDLLLWMPLTNITASGTTIEFVDSDATNFNRRFYRIVEYPY